MPCIVRATFGNCVVTSTYKLRRRSKSVFVKLADTSQSLSPDFHVNLPQHSRHGLLRRAVRGSDHEPSERLWLEEGASLFVAVDRLAAEWTQKRMTVADPAVRNKSASSPLQPILMNEQFFVDNGCGSPKAFFAPYLR
jgi:hypothetical protein